MHVSLDHSNSSMRDYLFKKYVYVISYLRSCSGIKCSRVKAFFAGYTIVMETTEGYSNNT